jgi:hypothetical protein
MHADVGRPTGNKNDSSLLVAARNDERDQEAAG